jgi:hypothetical protein
MVRRANQLTVRDLEPRVLAEVERVARSEGLSLNKAAAKLLRAGAGLTDKKRARTIGAAVDRFVGSLSAAEAGKLLRSVSAVERVDDELWK